MELNAGIPESSSAPALRTACHVPQLSVTATKQPSTFTILPANLPDIQSYNSIEEFNWTVILEAWSFPH